MPDYNSLIQNRIVIEAGCRIESTEKVARRQTNAKE